MDGSEMEGERSMTQALVATGRGVLELASTPTPVIGPGQLLVRTRVSAVSSGTERRMLYGYRGREDRGHPGWPQVGAFGYLAAGDVVEVGRDVAGFAIGDRVACGRTWGAHREMLDVNAESATKIPDELSYRDAACAYWAVPPRCGILAADPAPDAAVAIVGLGPLGLCGIEQLGPSARPVLGIDPLAPRRKLAEQRGAHTATPDEAVEAATLDALIGGPPAAVIECSGTQAGLELALEIVRPMGRVALVGSLPPLDDFDLFWPLQIKGTHIVPIHRPSADSPQSGGASSPRALHLPSVLEEIIDGRLRVDDLCSWVVDPADAQAALDLLHAHPALGVGMAIAWDRSLVEHHDELTTALAQAS